MVVWELYEGSAAVWDAQLEALGASCYQSYGWGEVRRTAGWRPVRMLAMSAGNCVAAASILVKFRAGVAVCWIPGGPTGPVVLFGSDFRRALKRLLGAWALYCRVSLLRAEQPGESEILVAGNWKRPARNMSSGLTVLYSLEGNEETRLKRASANWRHNLKRSGRYNLRVERWETPDVAALLALYREMEARKSIPVQHTKDELTAIIHHLKDRVVLYRCLDTSGNLLAVRAAYLFGDRAMDLLAVAGGAARKVYASHAILWALLNHCQDRGLHYYDLSGVDPVGNKGVFDFKSGTGAQLVECVGEREWANVPGMRLAVNWILKRRENARQPAHQ